MTTPLPVRSVPLAASVRMGSATAVAAAVSDPPAAAERSGPRAVELPIGAILRQVRRLTETQLEQVQRFQHERGVRFGEAAIALELVSRDDVLWALSQQFHYPYAASGGGAGLSTELVVALEPFGEQAEAFRELRSQLLAGVLSRHTPPRALAVLSASPGDGKSYFAANMAIALSQLGGRTLLVDADMRTPRQDVLFGLAQPGGLSGILSGRCGQEVVRRVPNLPALHVLTVGTLPPNPLDLIQRANFEVLLKELVNEFDHVLVDTPAASHGADGRVVAAYCGAAIVIGRRHVSALKPMQALLRELARTPTQLAGVLVNEHGGMAAPRSKAARPAQAKRSWWKPRTA